MSSDLSQPLVEDENEEDEEGDDGDDSTDNAGFAMLKDTVAPVALEVAFSIIIVGVFGVSWAKILSLVVLLFVARLSMIGLLLYHRGDEDTIASVLLLGGLVPGILLGGWITCMYLDSGINPQDSSRTCYYHEVNKTIESFETRLGLEHHVVTYHSFSITCQAAEWWAQIIAMLMSSLFPPVMQFGLPLLFVSVVLGTLRNGLRVPIISGMYTFLQLTILDFFDVIDFLLIGWNPINFVYLAANPIWRRVLPWYYLAATIVVMLEAAIAYNLLPSFRKSPTRHTCCLACLSMCIDLPLFVLRTAFTLNGLKVSAALAAKNALMLTVECAMIWYQKANNPVNRKISKILSFIPGADKLDREYEKEKRFRKSQKDSQKRNSEKEKFQEISKAYKSMQIKLLNETSATNAWLQVLRGDQINVNPDILEKAFKYHCNEDDYELTDKVKGIVSFCLDKLTAIAADEDLGPRFNCVKQAVESDEGVQRFKKLLETEMKIKDDKLKAKHLVLIMQLLDWWIEHGYTHDAPWAKAEFDECDRPDFLIVSGKSAKVDGKYEIVEDMMPNGLPCWHKKEEGKAVMAIYNNKGGRWAATIPENIKHNRNFMLSVKHMGKWPDELEGKWGTQKSEIFTILENVTVKRVDDSESKDGDGEDSESKSSGIHQGDDNA